MANKLKIYACSGVGEPVAVRSKAASVLRSLQNGWETNETLRKYLGTSKDGGCAEYFLYTFIPESDLSKYNAQIYNKRKGQLKTYKYVRELFVGHNYGTEAEMQQIIRNGIEQTFGMPVDRVLLGVRNGTAGVGEPISMAVASIIVAVISAVLAIITGIIEYAKSVKVAKYTAPTYQELEDSMPTDSDISLTGNTKKSGLLIAGLALAGVVIAKLFKNN